jgi:hypothetical protein
VNLYLDWNIKMRLPGLGWLLPVGLLLAGSSDAFTSSRSGAAFQVGKPTLVHPTAATTFRPKPVYLFGRNKKEDGEADLNDDAEEG